MGCLLTVLITTIIVSLFTIYVTTSSVKVTISKTSWDKAEKLVASHGGKLTAIVATREFDYLISDDFHLKAWKDPVNGYNKLELVNNPLK